MDNDVSVLKYWVLRTLPIFYDDTLHVQPLLCKIVMYLNNTMEDVKSLITDSDAESSNLETAVNNAFDAIAPKFDTDDSYAEGDYTVYNEELYVFTSEHTGEWDASDATKITVSDILASHESAIQQNTSNITSLYEWYDVYNWKMKIVSIAQSASVDVTVKNGTRGIILCSSMVEGGRGIYGYGVSSGGSISAGAIVSASGIALTTGEGKIQLANSASASTTAFIIATDI